MKNFNQSSFTHHLATLVFVCATLFTVASCKDDEAQPAPVAAPTLSDASAITATGFTTTWSAVTGADKYLLDVSTVNTFATTVTGFNKKEVTGTTTNVTGLTANTKYFFRVFTKKGTSTSLASATKEATTTN